MTETGSTERVEQFKADVAAMRLRDPATGRDRLLLRLGVVAMAVGIGMGVYAWVLSSGANGPLQQRDAIVQALLGLTVATVGAAAFVKASLAGFLRFWMARLCYEQQAQADRIAAAVAPPSRSAAAPAPAAPANDTSPVS